MRFIKERWVSLINEASGKWACSMGNCSRDAYYFCQEIGQQKPKGDLVDERGLCHPCGDRYLKKYKLSIKPEKALVLFEKEKT